MYVAIPLSNFFYQVYFYTTRNTGIVVVAKFQAERNRRHLQQRRRDRLVLEYRLKRIVQRVC